MFKCCLSDYTLLKSSFDSIKGIVDEVQFQVDSEGLRLNALDNSHITFIHLEFTKMFFDEFECTEPVKINVDTFDLMKVLNRGKRDDRLYLYTDENNLILNFIGDADKTFKLRLIDMEYTNPEPPELALESTVTIPFKLLKDTITDMDLFSEKVQICVTNEKTVFKSKGEQGDSIVEYDEYQEVPEDKEFKSIYSLSKIRELLKADKFTDTAILKLSEDTPLKLVLKSNDDTAELSFLLAPRIESME